MSLPLEDFYEDIIGKAQRGLQLPDATLITQSGITAHQLQSAQSGEFDETVARKLAFALQLNPDALIASGRKSWQPQIDRLPDHLWQLTTDYKRVMTVNAYVAAHPDTRQALIFDSGADARPILELIQQQQLSAAAVLITHAHGDHILGVPGLQQQLSIPVIALNGSTAGDQHFNWGDTLSLAGFEVECRRTTGHAPDGTTFTFNLGQADIAITGDALFAGSMGGANQHWQEALRYTQENILSLPDHTWLCPGHGPITTVAQEKQHNPFFA